MANEAVLMIESEIPVNMTCADGAGIERGAICKMTDPNTAVLADGDEDIVAGIAANEKIASNGLTSIAIYRGGDFKVVLCGSCTVGDALITNASSGGSNTVLTAGVNAEDIIGIAKETGAEGETILMELKPRTNNLA